MNVQYISQWRYPDGTIKLNLPTGQVPGYPIPTKFSELTDQQRNTLGYNVAMLIRKDPEYDYTDCITSEWGGPVYKQILTKDPVFREEELFPIYYANKQTEIKDKADQTLAPFGARFSQYESVSWAVQEKEADGWLADNTYPTPMIDGMIAITGEDKQELCNTIITNAANWSSLSGALFGQRQAFTDALNAAKKCAEIKAIEVNYVVPELAG